MFILLNISEKKRILTIQMFLFRAHYFVSGGLAYCFGDGGSRYTVLGCGYPVSNALPRHLLSPQRNKRLLTNIVWLLSSGVGGFFFLEKVKKTSSSSATLSDPHLHLFPTLVEIKIYIYLKKKKLGYGRRGPGEGGNKEKRNPTTPIKVKMSGCFGFVAVSQISGRS